MSRSLQTTPVNEPELVNEPRSLPNIGVGIFMHATLLLADSRKTLYKYIEISKLQIDIDA